MKFYLDQLFYPHYTDQWDDFILRDRINAKLEKDHIVLDFGAGRGNVRAMDLSEKCAMSVGVDVDKAVLNNPYLDRAYLIHDHVLPFEDSFFDLVISDNVFEHVEDPCSVMREIGRVMKSGGYLIFKTPNKNHYMPLIARLTPFWFHKVINKWRGRNTFDTFPTLYRFNTLSDIRKKIPNTLEIQNIELIEGRPEYLRHFGILYLFGIFYERLVNRIKVFSYFRVIIVGSIRKR